MELPEDDIPKSIFLDLPFEDTSFCLPDSEPVTVLYDKFFPEPFPDPVADIVPEHRSEYRRGDGQCEVFSSPESSYEDHYIHPGDGCTDKGK